MRKDRRDAKETRDNLAVPSGKNPTWGQKAQRMLINVYCLLRLRAVRWLAGWEDAGGHGTRQSQIEPEILCLSQLLDLLVGPGGSQHAAFVATWSESPAADDRGGGGQLPRDSGQAAHRACSPSLPSAMDAGESKSQRGPHKG